MSANLYETCVRLGIRCSVAKRPGFVRSFSALPLIPGLPMYDWLDWSPEVGGAEIKPEFEPRRELDEHEIAAIRNWLASLPMDEVQA